jgi:tRNA(Ile)-lysidine synthase
MKTHVMQKLIGYGIKQGDIVGAAVSGGIDSMVLLDILCNLRTEMNIIIVVFHFEHGIRGENSLKDMRFVVHECEKRGIECVTDREDVIKLSREKGLSIETAAREARYAFLDAQDAAFIATAHHAGDMAETVIMNLCRGSGLAGLCGIPEVRGRYIRPLLDITREEIKSYASENGVSYVHDSTNDDNAYTRNYVRSEILPRLKSVNQKAVSHIAQTAKLLAEDEAALNEAARSVGGIEDIKDSVTVDIETLINQPPAIRKRMLRLAVRRWGLMDLTQGHVDDMLALAEKRQSGKRIELPHELVAAVEYGKLSIGKNKGKTYNDTLIDFFGEGRYTLGNIDLHCERCREDVIFLAGTEYFDSERLNGACFRTRREADYIYPLGLGGKKRLSDYLSDKKVPLLQRDKLVVLARGSEVFWVVGVGVSETTKVRQNSQCFKIKYEEI